ncbi:MAG: hypothetical protein KC584_03765 [Nitrospira sp.]|nr:hypothetical protein [Nitrospira sp.]
MLVALLTPPFCLFTPFEQDRHGGDPRNLPTLISLPHFSLASYVLLLPIQKFSSSHVLHIGLGTLNRLKIPSDSPPDSQDLLNFQK